MASVTALGMIETIGLVSAIEAAGTGAKGKFHIHTAQGGRRGSMGGLRPATPANRTYRAVTSHGWSSR